MLTDGVRILDKINRVVSVKLEEILDEIINGESFHWSILSLYAVGHLGEGIDIGEFQRKILKMEKGLVLSWKDLNEFQKKLWDIYDILIIGSKNFDVIHHYELDQEMYESCDIVINLFDSAFWEVFSKDKDLLKRLTTKFKDVIPIKSDFVH